MNRIIELNNIQFYAFESKDQIIELLKSANNDILFAVNARKLMTSPSYIKEAINSNIGYVDGKGAIWAAKRVGYKDKLVRIPCVELWLDIIKAFPEKKYYLIGSTDEVINTVVKKLNKQFQGIKIVGFRNGYFSSSDYSSIITSIKETKPDVIFVAMGSPKQENIMIEMKKYYKAIYMGLGGSFDVYAGNVKRAPKFFQKIGLEGPYRFISNPKRLFDRKIFYLDYFRKLILGDF